MMEENHSHQGNPIHQVNHLREAILGEAEMVERETILLIALGEQWTVTHCENNNKSIIKIR